MIFVNIILFTQYCRKKKYNLCKNERGVKRRREVGRFVKKGEHLQESGGEEKRPVQERRRG
jgi:hypothetical protein